MEFYVALFVVYALLLALGGRLVDRHPTAFTKLSDLVFGTVPHDHVD